MKRVFLRLAGFLALIMATAGCTEVDGIIQVRRDGSGSIRLQMGVMPDARTRYDQTRRILEQLGLDGSAVLGGINLGAPGQPLLPKADMESLAKQLGPAVKLAQYRTFKKASGVEGVESVFEFPDIRKVRWVWPDAKNRSLHRGGFGFDFVSDREPVLKILPIEPTSTDDGMGAAAAVSDRLENMPIVNRLLSKLVEGMHLRLTVQTESAVTRSNANPAAKGNAVTLAEINARSMDGKDVPLLFGLRTWRDLAALRRRQPAGMTIQDPGRVIILQMANAPGAKP